MLENDPLWYKDAIIYQLHVRSFHDSIGDGIGDFRGLAQKLDYLQDLGITAIWLLPFYPSPLKDDGYDIADYTSINPDYGTLRDFKTFLKEANNRGLRVITELVLNHTSDQHPWFKRARKSPPGSVYRDFYVWSDTPEKYKEARIIFQDFEASNWTWDPVAKAYYWHRFYSHQPDLNYDNPEVWKAIFPLLDFWMELGVNGMRLDAVPYLYQREGTNCENLPETHEFLKKLREHVDNKFANRMVLAEANQWPEDAVAYFGKGDECHMAFHFPVMPRMFMGIHMEDSFPMLDIMDQTPTIPDNCQWCMFLRNHDELTLEMVTDEERDYMYRAYATDARARVNLGIRRRLAPLLGNNRRRIELMNALLFSMPGTPVIYYGDEVGMGDNIYLGDRNGVRTPMQWSADRNAGFSRANPQRLYLPIIIDPEYHYEAINVEAQQNNPNSLLWWMKRLMALRKQYKAFGRGTLEFLHPENRKILAFLRRYSPSSQGGDRGGEECLLVVANLSRFVQYVELDLSEFHGNVPIELFGKTPFPPIGKLPYLLTLAPHTFYWFSLAPQTAEYLDLGVTSIKEMKALAAPAGWEELVQSSGRSALDRMLARYLKQRAWFAGAGRPFKSAGIRESLPVHFDDSQAYVLLVQADYSEGGPDTYLIPVLFAEGKQAAQLIEEMPHAIIARVQSREVSGILYDALVDPRFAEMVFDAIRRSALVEAGTEQAALAAMAFPSFEENPPEEDALLTPNTARADPSNTTIQFGNQYALKIYRRLEEGLHPELEVGRFLTERKFPNTPPVVGSVELQKRRGEPLVLGLLLKTVPNQGEAWQFTLDELSSYFERVLAEPEEKQLPASPASMVGSLGKEVPEDAVKFIGSYLEMAALLGRRLGEMHVVLASESDDPAFTPEPFGKLYQRGIYQSMRNLVGKTSTLLRRRLADLSEETRKQGQQLLGLVSELLKRFQTTLDRKMTGLRIRYHGDFHLGQVLFTGKDFVIIDFEGEPARSLADRRSKRSPVRDVSKMVLSFHNAAFSALHGHESARGRLPGVLRPKDIATLESWARYWHHWVSVSFVNGYLQTVQDQPFLPQSREEFHWLLELFLIEKALYELDSELNHRPDWVQIPLLAILRFLGS